MVSFGTNLKNILVMSNYYCQQECGEEDFSIDEWNKAFDYCVDMNLNEKDTRKILEGDPCKEQCFDCMAIVGKRQIKTKELANE